MVTMITDPGASTFCCTLQKSPCGDFGALATSISPHPPLLLTTHSLLPTGSGFAFLFTLSVSICNELARNCLLIFYTSFLLFLLFSSNDLWNPQ
jgi:hypothetical protein